MAGGILGPLFRLLQLLCAVLDRGLELVARFLKGDIPSLDLCQHLVEPIDQLPQFILTGPSDSDRIVLLL
jgi:hypothetical protein